MKITFPGLLIIVFITLKLAGYIAWSWPWVLAPLWAPLALAAFLLTFAGILNVIILVMDRR